jgi:uncharacterized protein
MKGSSETLTTRDNERIAILDILRGFALIGIFLVNMLDFSGSGLRADTIGLRGGPLDRLADVCVVMFAVTKFYLLFSFLFGVGFAIQMQRMEQSGRNFVRVYSRRLFVLLLIGLAQSILVWDGDILRLYAVAGALMIPLRAVRTRTLVTLAGIIMLCGTVYFGAVPLEKASTLMARTDLSVYTAGSYADLVKHRLADTAVLDIQIPMVFVMFFLGLAMGRAGVMGRIHEYAHVLRRTLWWTLPAGLAGSVLMLVGYADKDPRWVSVSVHVGAPLLSYSYAVLVVSASERLGFLAYAGRMALTNYLMQSLVSTTIFYGYGFGLYDSLSPLQSNIAALGIFMMQLLVSRWWLHRATMGPMEWLWRSLTYGRMPGLLKASGSSR